MLGVRGMGLGAALTFGAVLWWASRGTESVADGTARLREVPASHAESVSANAWRAPAVRDDPADAPLPHADASVFTEPADDAGFRGYVEKKFRYLLEPSDRLADGGQALRAALLERERLVTRINTLRQASDEAAREALPELTAQVAETDQRIRQMLPAADIGTFDVLRESHMEQFQFDDFVEGIGNVAAVDERERRALLLGKLAHRARFRSVLEQSGLMNEDTPPARRQAALAQASRALREAHEGFLEEARQHLNGDERYTLLSNYETTEYTAELEKLRRIAEHGVSNTEPGLAAMNFR